MKKDRQGTIVANLKIADGIFEMKIAFDDFEDLLGGQFIHIKLPCESFTLRRPFCICDFDKIAKTIAIVYAVVGGGTEYLATLGVGQKLWAMFPLGNGFCPTPAMKKIVLVGGGLGSAVLPAVVRAFGDINYYTFLGFGNKDKVILQDLMSSLSESLVVATDDGSYGLSGFVTNVVAEQIDEIAPDAVFCCGPEVMYKSIKKVLAGKNIPIYVSLEARMGCGIGACLVCNCKIKRDGTEEYLRVCKDGPVFCLDEVVL